MKTRSSAMRPRNLSTDSASLPGSADLLEALECRTHLALSLPPAPTHLNNYPVDSAVTADFDGDGLTDLVASRAKVMLFYKGAADGSFADPIRTNLPTPVGTLTVGRFNGDLRPDIASVAKVPGATPNKPAVGLIVRTMYFDPASGRFEVGARLRVGDADDAAANCPAPRIASGNFVSGVRDEIVVALGSKTDIRLLRLPDRASMVEHSVLLNNDNAALIAFAVGTGLPGATPGRAQLASIVAEKFSSTLVVTTVYGDTPAARYTEPVFSAAADGISSVAIGDVDGDARADIVVGGASITLLRNIVTLGGETFAPAETLDVSGAYGTKRGESVTDINDDGRADIVFEAVTYTLNSRIDSVMVQPMVAVQDADGDFDAFRAGDVGYQTLWSVPFGTTPSILGTVSVNSSITARVGTLGLPAVFNFGSNGLSVSVTTEELFAPIVGEAGATYDGGPGGSILKTGVAYAQVRDQDPMRGGHVVRVEFVVDLNHNGVVDETDPTLCIATTPPAPGEFWHATYEVPLEWDNGNVTLFVRAIDNDGLASAWSATPFAIYPV